MDYGKKNSREYIGLLIFFVTTRVVHIRKTFYLLPLVSFTRTNRVLVLNLKRNQSDLAGIVNRRKLENQRDQTSYDLEIGTGTSSDY
jgi:hypothetical protein